MKRFAFCILFVAILVSLTGCYVKDDYLITEVYKLDVASEYSDYWDYALEDYDVVESDWKIGNVTGTIFSYEYKDYTFTYEDSESNLQSFVISNANDIDFVLEGICRQILGDEIGDMLQEHEDQAAPIPNVDRIKHSSNGIGRKDETITYHDPEHGVKMKDLSLTSLDENNLVVYIGYSCYLEHGISDNPDIKEDLLNHYKFLFDNHDYNDIVIRFQMIADNEESKSSNSRLYYRLTYDGENYTWTEENQILDNNDKFIN